MNSYFLKSLVLCLLFPLSTLAQESIDESRTVASNERISIEVISGKVSIRGTQDNVFRVRGMLAEDAEGYILESNNGFTRFEVEMPRRGFWNQRSRRDSDESELEIEVPMGAAIEFAGVNIDINVTEIHGSSDITTVNGDIYANNLSNIVSLSTVNGKIENRNSDGRIKLASVNGEIFDEDSEGRIEFTTVNGEVVSASRAQEVSIETVNGEAELDLVGTEVLEMSTVNGDIDVRLAGSFSPRIEGSTVSGDLNLIIEGEISAHFSINAHAGGDIENLFSDDRATRDQFGPRKQLNFKTKDAQGSINLTTVSGDIEIDDL